MCHCISAQRKIRGTPSVILSKKAARQWFCLCVGIVFNSFFNIISDITALFAARQWGTKSYRPFDKSRKMTLWNRMIPAYDRKLLARPRNHDSCNPWTPARQFAKLNRRILRNLQCKTIVRRRWNIRHWYNFLNWDWQIINVNWPDKVSSVLIKPLTEF